MARNFNGTNQFLSMAAAPASGSPMTIAAWFYPTQSLAQVLICVGQNSGTHRNQLTFDGNVAGRPIRAFSLGTGGSFQAQGGSTTLNEWNHACAVFGSATSREIFANGASGATNTSDVGTQNAATGTQIGARTASNATSLYFNGNIAEVGIWNAALSDAEIASLAKGMTCDKVRPQNLVFYAPLVRDLIDPKGGLTITNNNGATVATHPRVYA
jgi:hypothetical protein